MAKPVSGSPGDHIDTELLGPGEAELAQAVQALQAGKLVAFPTETVYGLGALVTKPDAIAAIFNAKGRPADHPLIAHVPVGFSLESWADVSSPIAQRLMEAFWPGPLTLIVPKGPSMPNTVSGGQQSLGVRCPSHSVAQRLLSAIDAPVAAPSANRFGKVSPTCARHVFEELNGRIDYVLDGGVSAVGIESTIVSVLDGQPVLLRPGSITRQQIEQVLGEPLRVAVADRNTQSLRVSGNLEQHYCPDAQLVVCDAETLTSHLRQTPSKQYGHPEQVVAIGWSSAFIQAAQLANRVVSLPKDAKAVAHALYAQLREADRCGARVIYFEKAPVSCEWDGVADRLKRAASTA